ncbi:hypothetical protein BDY19DRAFT_903528 [Irpex rosettiformis]|uniref:Uncharacterized protein n=1 Tax=Irpex rosettiformis TaxID=378272 RepID=A0ACB8UGH0_9APHY|nr:hypothetical protein BDY19DRAFT_903528 [Irpex rosettiformis]
MWRCDGRLDTYGREEPWPPQKSIGQWGNQAETSVQSLVTSGNLSRWAALSGPWTHWNGAEFGIQTRRNVLCKVGGCRRDDRRRRERESNGGIEEEEEEEGRGMAGCKRDQVTRDCDEDVELVTRWSLLLFSPPPLSFPTSASVCVCIAYKTAETAGAGDPTGELAGALAGALNHPAAP